MPDADQTFPPRISNELPLSELLTEEIKPLRERAEQLVKGVEQAVIDSKKTLDDATTLGVLIGDCINEVDKKRETAKAPHLANCRLVDSTYGGIIGLLATYDKSKVVGGPLHILKVKVNAYLAEQERIATAERHRLEEEARVQREAAALAERKRLEAEVQARREQEDADRRVREAEEAARKSGDRAAAAEAARQREAADAEASRQRETSLRAEIEARRQSDEAERLSRAASATTAAPTKNEYGMSSSRRTTKKAVIIDFATALKYAVKIDKTTIEAAVQAVYDRQLKAKATMLPGAEIKEVSDVSFRG